MAAIFADHGLAMPPPARPICSRPRTQCWPERASALRCWLVPVHGAHYRTAISEGVARSCKELLRAFRLAVLSWQEEPLVERELHLLRLEALGALDLDGGVDAAVDAVELVDEKVGIAHLRAPSCRERGPGAPKGM